MNSTPLLLQGCMAVISLSLILGYTLHRCSIGRCGCGKVCRLKLRGGSVSSAEVRRMPGMDTVEVCLLLEVCAVVLVLLLMAGDVEKTLALQRKTVTRAGCSHWKGSYIVSFWYDYHDVILSLLRAILIFSKPRVRSRD